MPGQQTSAMDEQNASGEVELGQPIETSVVSLPLEPQEAQPSPNSGSIPRTFWGWVGFRLFGRVEDEGARLQTLSDAIRLHPNAAVNYLLRGEFYLRNGQLDQAIEDFLNAIDKAEAEAPQQRWGLQAQAVRDRALYGLRLARFDFSNTSLLVNKGR
ncbi:MAG: hypothetical protein ACOYLB_01635 [Phototrophicaceae bacterium]